MYPSWIAGEPPSSQDTRNFQPVHGLWLRVMVPPGRIYAPAFRSTLENGVRFSKNDAERIGSEKRIRFTVRECGVTKVGSRSRDDGNCSRETSEMQYSKLQADKAGFDLLRSASTMGSLIHYPEVTACNQATEPDRIARLHEAFGIMCAIARLVWRPEPGWISEPGGVDVVQWDGAVVSLTDTRGQLEVSWKDAKHRERYGVLAELAWEAMLEPRGHVRHELLA